MQLDTHNMPFSLSVFDCIVDDEFVHVSMENSEPVSYHLYDQLKRHLYKKKERIPVVVRPEEFQFAFSCFENYEVRIIYVQNCCKFPIILCFFCA